MVFCERLGNRSCEKFGDRFGDILSVGHTDGYTVGLVSLGRYWVRGLVGGCV